MKKSARTKSFQSTYRRGEGRQFGVLPLDDAKVTLWDFPVLPPPWKLSAAVAEKQSVGLGQAADEQQACRHLKTRRLTSKGLF